VAYATLADLYAIGIPENALSGVLDAACELADGYLSRYPRPFTTEDMGLRRAVCCIAAYDLLTARGYNPGSGADVNMRLRAEDAMRWLEKVAAGAINITTVTSAPAGNIFDSPIVVTAPRQGW
jgi:phage gp36-like protein